MSDGELNISCPICMEIYSDSRYPIVSPACGHSICVDCGNRRKSHQCVTCQSECFEPGLPAAVKRLSNNWPKNYDLLSLINIHTKPQDPIEAASEMKCPKCKNKEKMERMKICSTCAVKWNKDWREKQEEQILPFIICAFCCVEKHESHVFAKYLPYKLKAEITSTVADGQYDVSSMDEVCMYEVEMGKKQLAEWKTEFDSFPSSIDCNYRDGVTIRNTLKREADLVTRVSDDCLPSLRKYRKVVTESVERVKQLKNGLKREDDGSGTNNLKQIDRAAVQEPVATGACEEDFIVTLQRLGEIRSDRYCADGAPIDRLYISLSRKIYLYNVEVYRSIGEPNGAKGILKIFSMDYSMFALENFNVLPGTADNRRQKVQFTRPVKLEPNKPYLLELMYDKPVVCFYGVGNPEQIELSPGYTLTFSEHPTSRTTIMRGQFSGFCFATGN